MKYKNPLEYFLNKIRRWKLRKVDGWAFSFEGDAYVSHEAVNKAKDFIKSLSRKRFKSSINYYDINEMLTETKDEQKNEKEDSFKLFSADPNDSEIICPDSEISEGEKKLLI